MKAAQRKAEKEKRKEQFRNKSLALQKGRELAAKKPEPVKTEKVPSAPQNRPAIKLKSKAKAAGVKSVFVVGDQVVMTSFGKGNDAILEKSADQTRVISSLNTTDPKYDVAYDAKQFAVTGKIFLENENGEVEPIRTTLQDHYDSILKEDNAFKSAVEKRYFGEECNDNIHIQLIYNIFDIEKLLAPHVNNIVYSLNAAGNKDANTFENGIEIDQIGLGHITTKNRYNDVLNCEKCPDEKARVKLQNSRNDFQALLGEKGSETRKRLAYYGDLFYQHKEKRWLLKEDKELYNIIAMISDLRQFCMHDTLKEDQISENNWGRTFLYQLDSALNEEAKATLDEIFLRKADELKKEAFGETAGKSDVTILLRAYGKEKASDAEKRDLIQKFYDFKIKKEYKNLGFSIKQLRETILLLPEAQKYGNKEDTYYNSVRHKLYGLLDFIITCCYLDDNRALCAYLKNDPVSLLRACRSEEEKAAVYNRLAVTIWEGIHPKVEIVDREIQSYSAVKDKKAFEASAVLFDGIDGINTNVSTFSKMIFLLTKFLDGKEINTLCTSLIHKFENIASFLDILKRQGLKYEIEENYRFFNSAKEIAEELRQINNMARMSAPMDDVDVKLVMLRDAAELLGIEESKSDDELCELYHLEKAGEKQSGRSKKSGKDTSLRNFINKNVVTSRRFLYLIRFVDPKKIRSLAVDPGVIRFVLKEIPDEQIRRYYEAVGETAINSPDNMRAALQNRLVKVNFEQFKNVNNKDKGEEKQQMQAIVRLYLTIPYVFVKNLVNVNARYVLAFHCLERDNAINQKYGRFDGKTYLATKKVEAMKERIRLLEEENQRKKASGEKYSFREVCRLKHQMFLQDNPENTTNDVRIDYRNAVAHLNVISQLTDLLPTGTNIESYFSVYHLCMQKYLLAMNYEKVSKGTQQNVQMTKHYFDMVAQTDHYSKDFVKALNAPFAYNLPRFKNLSIDGLFDKDRPGKDEVQKER